jgi:hypothetical protein
MLVGLFWDTHRTVMRRRRSLASLDPDVGKVIAARDARRPAGLEAIVTKLGDQYLFNVDKDQAARTLFTLMSFETFDSLAKASPLPRYQTRTSC